MNTEELSAEEILESTAGHPIDAMEQYARQQNYALREQLKQRDETILTNQDIIKKLRGDLEDSTIHFENKIYHLRSELHHRDETIKHLELEHKAAKTCIEFRDIQLQQADETIKELKEALRDILPLAEQYIHYLGYQPIQPKQDREELIKIHSAEIETIRKLLTE